MPEWFSLYKRQRDVWHLSECGKSVGTQILISPRATQEATLPQAVLTPSGSEVHFTGVKAKPPETMLARRCAPGKENGN